MPKSRLLLQVRKYGNIHRLLSVVRRRLLGVPSGESEGIYSAEIPSSSWDMDILSGPLRAFRAFINRRHQQYINIREYQYQSPPPAVLSSISISESPPQQYINIRIAATAVYQYQNRRHINMSVSETPSQQYINIRIAATAVYQYQNSIISSISISESHNQQQYQSQSQSNASQSIISSSINLNRTPAEV
jgi:hypothetical protein